MKKLTQKSAQKAFDACVGKTIAKAEFTEDLEAKAVQVVLTFTDHHMIRLALNPVFVDIRTWEPKPTDQP